MREVGCEIADVVIASVESLGLIDQVECAERTPEGWSILLYAPFAKAFSALPENELVRMRPAKPSDFEARKQRV